MGLQQYGGKDQAADGRPRDAGVGEPERNSPGAAGPREDAALGCVWCVPTRSPQPIAELPLLLASTQQRDERADARSRNCKPYRFLFFFCEKRTRPKLSNVLRADARNFVFPCALCGTRSCSARSMTLLAVVWTLQCVGVCRVWCGAGFRPRPLIADSECFVISGVQLSKALHPKAEQLRREYLLVTHTLTHVTATSCTGNVRVLKDDTKLGSAWTRARWWSSSFDSGHLGRVGTDGFLDAACRLPVFIRRRTSSGGWRRLRGRCHKRRCKPCECAGERAFYSALRCRRRGTRIGGWRCLSLPRVVRRQRGRRYAQPLLPVASVPTQWAFLH